MKERKEAQGKEGNPLSFISFLSLVSRSTWPTWCGYFSVALGATLVLYGRTLALPYFWDDVPNFDFALARDLGTLWTNNAGFPYYRPVLFTFWRLLFYVWSPEQLVVLLHAVSLALHSGSAALIGLITARLCPPKWRESAAPPLILATWAGIIATLCFAAYPFAALNTAYVAGQFHSAVTLGTLLGVWMALKAMQESRPRWFFGAALACALTPYIHEAGVVCGPLVAGAILLSTGPGQRIPWAWVLILPLLSASFLPVWLLIPKDRGGGYEWQRPDEYFASLTFFTQALTFPMQRLARWLLNRGVWDLSAIWIVNALAALGVGIAWRAARARLWLPLGFGLLWTIMTMAPSVVALPYYYIVVSQRLLNFIGPGAAVVWAVTGVALASRFQSAPARSLIMILLASLIVVPGAWFVWREVTLHEVALQPLQQLTRVVRAEPALRRLVVNAPMWVNFQHATYALGHEGVNVGAGYLTLADLVRVNTGVPANLVAIEVPEIITPNAEHYHEPYGERTSATEAAALIPQFDQVWVTETSADGFDVRLAGALMESPPAPPKTYVARFGDALALSEARFSVVDRRAEVSLGWYYFGLDPQATVFRHVFDCAGNVLGLGDGPAVGGLLTFDRVPPHAAVHDVRVIPLEAASPDGCYVVEVGLFRADGSRVPASAPDGSEFPNALVPIR